MINLSKTVRVHMDTEFTDFVNSELISIGLACANGAEFYGENLDFDKRKSSEFVHNVVYPLLNPDKYGMKETELSARVWCWLDDLDADFIILSAGHQTDMDLFYDLMGEKHPKILANELTWRTINRWINGSIVDDSNAEDSARAIHFTLKRKFFEYTLQYFMAPKEHQHHALSDAKADRHAWNMLRQEFAIPN